MASKVMVKIAVQPFSQVNENVNKAKASGVNGEVVPIGRTTEIGRLDAQKATDAPRVAQLEQNIRYLQEQHQLMLNGLHHEIDVLRHRNRELQFQLITGLNLSSPSSPDDDTKHKVYNSPKQVNITPLQVEILEKELSEMKVQWQESESRNVYLSAIVDEQKKKLERYERDRERERERSIQPDPELLRKLDDAESLIRRLRRENSDLRRENALTNPPAYQQREFHNRDGCGTYQQQQQPRGGGGGGNNRGNGRNRGNGGNHYRGNWFPPLHSQSYWQNGRGQERNGSASVDGTSLPSLPAGGGGGSGQYQGRRGGNNNHYNGEGRKYRGNQSRGQKPS
ncbi:PREDICTED: hrp65 protein-like isoform X1 [Nicrophorus vespilloides]|uniref:Hrp65 protein-like isoform X1 n=1 Tax=Nicrophorus vespilloides TaxID=110193 RepID=A0ABM1MSQ5_NICVS|nr:PREDICTED: hrp65 protein-like isoform X1 [Nicrophorus vespilloides]